MTKSDKPAEPSITDDFNLDPIYAHLYSNVRYTIENGTFSIIGKTSLDRKGALSVDHTGEVRGVFDGNGHTRIPTDDYKTGRLSAFCLHDRSKALCLFEDHPPRTSHKDDTLSPLTSIEQDGCSEGIHTAAFGLISDSYKDYTGTDTLAMAYGNGKIPTILPTIKTSVYSEAPIPSPSVPGSPQSTGASTANPSQGDLGPFKDECYF